jgi:hypothetical protein
MVEFNGISLTDSPRKGCAYLRFLVAIFFLQSTLSSGRFFKKDEIFQKGFELPSNLSEAEVYGFWISRYQYSIYLTILSIFE